MSIRMVVARTRKRGVFTVWLRQDGSTIATRDGRPDLTPGRHRRRWWQHR